MLNLSKTFEMDSKTNLQIGSQIGSQIGTVLVHINPRPLYNFDYIQIERKILDWLKLQSGVYYANKDVPYSTDVVGYMGGVIIKIIPRTLYFTTNYISSHNNISGAIANLNYYPIENFKVYIGVGVLERNNGDEFYGTLGATKSF